MGLVNPTLPVLSAARGDGEVNVRNDLIALLNEFNGNIDDANIKALANIAGSKLLNNSVAQAKLTTRIVFGTVAGGTSTARDAGSGDWTVSRTGLGTYVLTFTTPFSAIPAVVAGPAQSPSVSGAYNLEAQTYLVGSVVIGIRQPTVTFIDCDFSFIAVGLR